MEDLRLECLKLASRGQPAEDVVRDARLFHDFVIGTDRAALADEAKVAVDRAVR